MSNEVIMLNRMYAGKYLEENIGHEVINLFKDDNGNNYIYINDDGYVNPKYNGLVKAVILVKHVEKGVLEIIAKAEQLTQVNYKTSDVNESISSQIRYIKDNHITYGGVLLSDVYNKGVEQVSITYKTDMIRKVKRPIYLIEDVEKLDSYPSPVCMPEKHFSSQSLKMYYDSAELPKSFDALNAVINDDNYWEEKDTTERLDLSDLDSFGSHNGFLSLIHKEDDELIYSNLFAYFFKVNPVLFVKFSNEILGISHFEKEYKIVRESNDNIDLWIEDANSIIVIENKIKSKINGERHDILGKKIQSQLSKYYKYAVENSNGKEVYFYIFLPDYNFVNLDKYECGSHYKIVKYSQLYDFYFTNAGNMLHEKYFKEFIDALYLHKDTIDNSRFEEMKRRFINAIKLYLESH